MKRLNTATAVILALPYFLLVLVPALVLKLVTVPFERPRKLSPEQVATFLRKCIDGTATDGEIDFFISVDIADPRLDAIKEEVGAMFGPGWSSPETREMLEDILRRVEAMPACDPV